jgi:hypothetical protein
MRIKQARFWADQSKAKTSLLHFDAAATPNDERRQIKSARQHSHSGSVPPEELKRSSIRVSIRQRDTQKGFLRRRKKYAQ